MKPSCSVIVATSVLAISLSGCVGSNAVTGLLMKFNLQAVDNRYARGGLNMLLSPVYGLTIAADYLVFNSLEFWTGKNPISGQPHIFDSQTETLIDINDELDESLKDAPISPLTRRMIERGEVVFPNADTLMMTIVYNTGERAVLHGIRVDASIDYFLDGQWIARAGRNELEGYGLRLAVVR
ncbi:DUF3332 family protein [Vibrio ouci]|uniref:DUF3332 family protein n=1 Tax=Vibrio ouci TaxID=2499078 RepID=A0A4Y8WBG5_9VIBR|nr:DUF3332 family protein [Vibrio ouci]TFH90289.1 DUF3332 family protein [Vibrio ouci]